MRKYMVHPYAFKFTAYVVCEQNKTQQGLDPASGWPFSDLWFRPPTPYSSKKKQLEKISYMIRSSIHSLTSVGQDCSKCLTDSMLTYVNIQYLNIVS